MPALKPKSQNQSCCLGILCGWGIALLLSVVFIDTLRKYPNSHGVLWVGSSFVLFILFERTRTGRKGGPQAGATTPPTNSPASPSNSPPQPPGAQSRPSPPIRFLCGFCQYVLESPWDSEGEEMLCPKCSHPCMVPSLAAAIASPVDAIPWLDRRVFEWQGREVKVAHLGALSLVFVLTLVSLFLWKTSLRPKSRAELEAQAILDSQATNRQRWERIEGEDVWLELNSSDPWVHLRADCPQLHRARRRNLSKPPDPRGSILKVRVVGRRFQDEKGWFYDAELCSQCIE